MSIHLIQKYYAEIDKIIRYGWFKESVIELLGCVCTVGVETMRIVRKMSE